MTFDPIKGVATQIAQHGFKKLTGGVTGIVRDKISDKNNPSLSLARPASKYVTNQFSFPLDVANPNPGVGNHGHYMIFYINEQKGSIMGFGKEKTGATSVLEDASQRKTPKFIKRLQATGGYGKERNPEANTSGNEDLIKNPNYSTELGFLGTPEYVKGPEKAGRGQSTGLFLKRNPTTRLDTAITLFMPAQVSSGYSVEYGDMGIGGGAAIIGDIFNTLKGNLTDSSAYTKAFNDNIGRVGDFAAEGAFKTFTAAADLFLAPFGGDGIKQSLEAQMGVISSDRMELIFKGLNKRKFSFSFNMMPRNQQEAKEIRNIIFAFKANMLPEFADGNLRGRKLRVPNTFDIEYMYRGQANDYLNKISTCVLTSMDVKYGGSRYKAFDPDEDGSPPPVETSLSLTFEELELITKERVYDGY